MTRKLNSIVFATFAVRSHGQRTATNGMIEPMTYFFTKRSKRFTLIEQPHPAGEFVFIRNRRYDLFIGLEAVNAIAGILLRKLGIVKTVVYYVSDYSPDRYKPKWVNDLYL